MISSVSPNCLIEFEEPNILDFNKHVKWVDDLALVSQLGLTMAGSILFCFTIGYYLDKWLDTKGLFITIFILLGIAGGGYTVYRQIMQTTEVDENEKKQYKKPT